MANNLIYIKRTAVSGRTPNTTASYATNSQYISTGELALNLADRKMYSSDGTISFEIGSNLISISVSSNATLNVATVALLPTTDNSNNVPSTSWVRTFVTTNPSTVQIKTTGYTLALTDAQSIIEYSNSTVANSFLVPNNATVAFPVGTTIQFTQSNTGSLSISNAVGVNLHTTSSTTARAQWSSLSIYKRAATDEWVLTGDYA